MVAGMAEKPIVVEFLQPREHSRIGLWFLFEDVKEALEVRNWQIMK
jgi:hypothetical protein